MTNVIILFLVLLLAVSVVLCDIFMHNPRGSNNRNCERDNNARNQNRLFNSENNAAGGYACPRPASGMRANEEDYRMYYYVGSILRIEWTNQHSCGTGNAKCEFVLQYMCNDTSPGIRDGYPTDNQDTATTQIPDDPNPANPLNYGQHETYSNWDNCRKRNRNSGLYTADRQLGNQAHYTRQNNGARYGYECPEERDYYPYWHPTPWRDIAVFTHNVSRCAFYKDQSQNVANKGQCITSTGVSPPQNNRQACMAAGNTWQEVGKLGIPPPDCFGLDTVTTRDNHLGNAKGGENPYFDWTIPNTPNKACVLRIRYNITIGEVNFTTDSTSNAANSPVKQDPFKDFGGYGAPLSLAINTNQISRTFQDRSYTFEIRKRPANVPDNARIFNLGVRGKRGNLAAIYPSAEYDFVPNYLEVNGRSDYVHVQWTGSDYNPDRQGNAAEGGPPDYDSANKPTDEARADRSNMVCVDSADSLIPRPVDKCYLFFSAPNTPNMALIRQMAFLGQKVEDNSTCVSDFNVLLGLNNNNEAAAIRDVRNCAKLSGVKQPYFDAGLLQFKANGIHHYMSTRNNNFSNRQQKGTILVYGGDFNAANSRVMCTSLFAVMLLVLALFL